MRQLEVVRPRAEPNRPRVLAAVDLGPGSEVALLEAASLASSMNADLAAVHVLRAPSHGLFGWHATDGAKQERLRRRAEDTVQGLVEETLGRSATVFVEEGGTPPAIARRAALWRADVVVLGGWGHLDHSVIRHLRCDVLVAKPSKGRGPVIAAVDPSYASQRALRVAAVEAHRRGVELEVVRAMGFFETEASYLVELGTPTLHTDDRRTREVARNHLAESLAALGIDAIVEIVDPPAVAGIVETAEHIAAELVVVGHHDHVVGRGVSERVARAAPCSVLVVRS